MIRKEFISFLKENQNKWFEKKYIEQKFNFIFNHEEYEKYSGKLFVYEDEIIYIDRGKDYFVSRISIVERGYGFVNLTIEGEEKSFFVAPNLVKIALNGDIVLAKKMEPQPDSKGLEAEVIKIAKRNTEYVFGVLKKTFKNRYFLDISDTRLNSKQTKVINYTFAKINDYCKAQIIKVQANMIFLKIVESIGNANNVGADINSVIFQKGIKSKFDRLTIKASENILDYVSEKELKNRVDFRNKNFVTIDGDDSKDFDDAIYINKINDNYEIIVAIADVSHYVKKESFLDKEALKRGCSVYLIDRVIPMLPEKLSNGICSLNPKVDRLVLTIKMVVNNNGEVITKELNQSVINSKARLTYNLVNRIYKREADIRNSDIQNMLFVAKDLYNILKISKEKKGMIDFEMKEPKFILNDKKEIIDIKEKTRGLSEKMIEQFMVLANEQIAELCKNSKKPFVYRNHPVPSEEKIINLNKQLSLLGVVSKVNINNPTPIQVKNTVEEVKKIGKLNILSILFLRSMEKALYESNSQGHFGLASKNYTHFTSPIRRYPDLILHRFLRKYFIEKSNENIQQDLNDITRACEKSNDNEIKAIDCERSVNQLKICEYMKQFIGQKYNAVISAITKFGFFIQLPNTVEGLVHIKNLKDDIFIYNETSNQLVGERTKKTYYLSQKVEVILDYVNLKESKIDFKII